MKLASADQLWELLAEYVPAMRTTVPGYAAVVPHFRDPCLDDISVIDAGVVVLLHDEANQIAHLLGPMARANVPRAFHYAQCELRAACN